jgi:hypothetical protein
VLRSPKNRRLLLLKPYQVCNIRAKHKFGKTSDVFFITLIPKKTYAICPIQAMVACRESPVNKVLQASYGLIGSFSGNLTAFVQVVFRAKNLKKFSDIKLSFDASSKPFLYAV